jgi:hypothetical protein
VGSVGSEVDVVSDKEGIVELSVGIIFVRIFCVGENDRGVAVLHPVRPARINPPNPRDASLRNFLREIFCMEPALTRKNTGRERKRAA